MKTKILIALLALGMLVGCKKKTIRTIENDMSDGTWKISLFQENGYNHTSDYEIYTFNFNSNESVQATNNGYKVNGSWVVGRKNGHIEFNLMMPSPLEDLSAGWEVVSNSTTKLELKDINGGGSVDYLTFTKL